MVATSEAGSARGSELLTSRSEGPDASRALGKGPMRAAPPAGYPSLDLAGGSRRAHAMLLESSRRGGEDAAAVGVGGGAGADPASVAPSVASPLGAAPSVGGADCPHCSGRSGDRRQMAMHRQYGCPFVVAREAGGRSLNTVTSSKSILSSYAAGGYGSAAEDWQRSLWSAVAAQENAGAPPEYDPLTGRCVRGCVCVCGGGAPWAR